MSSEQKHLYNLGEFEDAGIENITFDIRGWEVKDRDQHTLGTVKNLLVHKELEKVVYIVVEVFKAINTAGQEFESGEKKAIREQLNTEEECFIIPIGIVELDLEAEYVYSKYIDLKTFSEMPRFKDGTAISREYEVEILKTFSPEIKDPSYSGQRTKLPPLSKRVDEEEKAKYREKEGLRQTMDRRSRPIDDHDRAMRHHELPRELQPERSVDEDINRLHDDLEINDAYVQQRHQEHIGDPFYNRVEFFRKKPGKHKK